MRKFGYESRSISLGLLTATILVLLTLPIAGIAQISGSDVSKKLDTRIEQIRSSFEIPGVSVVVTHKNKILYKRAFGVRSLKTGKPLQLGDTFHVASVSKPFVATAIMQLVESGKIKLDEKVMTYLPYFKLEGEGYKDITIRQMLNHTSGMPDVNDYEWDKPQYDEGAAERFVRGNYKERMLWKPGTKFRYSNMAFDTLGDVIAKRSGMSFEDYVKNNILNPLGMKNSSFLIKKIPSRLRTSPHYWKLKLAVSDVYPYNRRHAPSSTLNSSAIEMANWAIVNLNRGKYGKKRILRDSSYDALFSKSADVNGNMSVGLSWFLGTHRGMKMINHAGGDLGYSSYFVMFPEKDVGIIVLCNYDRAPVTEIYQTIADTLFGFEPRMPKPSVAMPLAKVFVEKGIEAAKAHYYDLRKNSADEYSFGAGDLNGLGYVLLREKRIKDAVEIFKFNVELYPKIANVWDSLGEGYAISGNKKLAIESYEKALRLDPTMGSAKKAIERLKSESKP